MAAKTAQPETLTDAEVLAVRVGDEVQHFGEWFPIQKIEGHSKSAGGWPICAYIAHHDGGTTRISSYLFNGTPRRLYRTFDQAQAERESDRADYITDCRKEDCAPLVEAFAEG